MKRIFFIPILKKEEKITYLTKIVADHFEKGEKLVIQTDREETLQYVDHLLWSYPKQSFIPHALLIKEPFFPLSETISITKEDLTDKIKEPIACFNLTKEPLLNTSWIKVYEFEDQSDPQKTLLSRYRFASYKKAKIPIAYY